MAAYDNVRSTVLQSGSDTRVEVNQRALIDKILARYASQGAIYRELLQNSNDAEASNAELHFTTVMSAQVRHVSQVVYRNDGLPFRDSDWSRLRNIAEGNPDVSKVGAFGVGAYTMFSICEEPLVISANTALAFTWRGDALWARSANVTHPDPVWTTFVLPSRDLYPLPDLVPFAQFLCASLTFTTALNSIRLYIDDAHVLSIVKSTVEPPTVVTPPRASSWWSNDGMRTTSPHNIFSLGRADGAISQTVVQIAVTLDGHTHTIRARYVSAKAEVRVPPDMHRRIQRVTKKDVPPQAFVHIFVDAEARTQPKKPSRAAEVTQAFSPPRGSGRVFIGFRTSQTTGLAAHLAAPLVPTVEREAIDFQDPALGKYNSDLLFVAGIVMRLTFENAISIVAQRWEKATPQRVALREKIKRKAEKDTDGTQGVKGQSVVPTEAAVSPKDDSNGNVNEKNSGGDGLFNFVRFMTSGVRRFAEAITATDTIDADEDLFNPPDLLPLSDEERDAIMLMRAFSPEHSTPDENVGALIANGFASCMPKLSPPVLTNSGVVRAADARLPHLGIEYFVKRSVIRKVVVDNAETFLKHVAGCRTLSVDDLVVEMTARPLSEDDFARFVKWWVKFSRAHPRDAGAARQSLRSTVSFISKDADQAMDSETDQPVLKLLDIKHYRRDELASPTLPMPATVISHRLQEDLTLVVLQEPALVHWFTPMRFSEWAGFIVNHKFMTEGRVEDDKNRLEVLVLFSKEYVRRSAHDRLVFGKWLSDTLGKRRCIPFESAVPHAFAAEFPTDLYLPNAEIGIFQGLGSFRRVSQSLEKAGVSNEFMIALGVRKAISIDFLFTQLDNLKWNNDPQPLIRYLRTATLTASDLTKLRRSQYLPAADDNSRTFSPSELYLPNDELGIFPFLKILQWPSTSPLHVRSPDADFLRQLGCRVEPPLQILMKFMVDDVKEDKHRVQCLEFLANRLGRGGVYEAEYNSFIGVKFLPVLRKHPFVDGAERVELLSPMSCYSNAAAMCMGFAVLDPKLDTGSGRMFGERFRCLEKPPADQLVSQLLNVITFAKQRTQPPISPSNTLIARMSDVLRSIFRYLSTRSGDLSTIHLDKIRHESFIPYEEGQSLVWYKPSEVYFMDEKQDIDSRLFKVIEFDAFLATVGVHSEPSTADLLKLIVASPEDVLGKVGGDKEYLVLLRRIAAAYPRSKVTEQMSKSPFLLSYRMSEDQEPEPDTDPTDASNGDAESKKTSRYSLSKASDICIIDNMFFARVFSVLTAPQESDLERFYESMGSILISQRVNTRYKMTRNLQQDTEVTRRFSARLMERHPLLVWSKSSRQLQPNADTMLLPTNVTVYQTADIKAKFTLQSVVKTQDVTCSAVSTPNRKWELYITEKFDWFDVGNAIGRMILRRCQVEDAYYIGSILKEPVSQLRSLGFPVDRILRTAPEPKKLEAEPGGPVPVVELEKLRDATPAGAGASAGAGISAATSSLRDKARTTGGEVGENSGFENILRQMFPNVSSEHITKLLGAAPTLETLRMVADSLADGNYPQENSGNTESTAKSSPDSAAITSAQAGTSNAIANVDQPVSSSDRTSSSEVKRDRGSPWWSKAFRSSRTRDSDNGAGKQGSSTGAAIQAGAIKDGRGSGVGGDGVGLGAVSNDNSGREVTPAHDAATNNMVQNALRRGARATRTVAPEGLSGVMESPEPAVSQPVIGNAPSCGSNAVHNLRPYYGRVASGMTQNGTRVFMASARTGHAFLHSRWAHVESLSIVLHNLCAVFEVACNAVAIFYEATGTTIAFNRAGTLYFNMRYDALHDDDDAKRYAFWFTTMAHELAHQVRPDHSREHAFFTESYVTTYIPKLLTKLRHVLQ